MDEKYFAKKIEQKWQQKWADGKTFEAEVHGCEDKPKFYALEMLPYPSGNLHMGHVRNYSAGDALSWYKRLKGYNVLHPFGWDSFGQPAEDAAIKRGVNPRLWTEENIVAMRGQLQRMGFSYDWRRQMYAHRPEYYKFDQWFFLKMYEMGLAYKKMTQVNWCEHDQATLSNEQASGGLCWRCGNPVTKKDMEQWFLRTTAYVDRLLDDMVEIESGWPASVVKRQQDWMGRSQGAFVKFDVKGADEQIEVFTTRIDTIYGANAIVVAAEHPVIESRLEVLPADVVGKISRIRAENLKTKDHEAEVEKDGIDTGLIAVNPFSGEELPVWVGNYVMMDYGTGAVMSVPGHDERDFAFARKFGLDIRTVIEADKPEGAEEDQSQINAEKSEVSVSPDAAFSDYGYLVNSAVWSGKTSEDAKTAMSDFAEEHGFGKKATTYRLRDWGVSRQRFWGSPIPIIYCDKCGIVPEKFENLPVLLPENVPLTGTGESPLAKVAEFVNTTCPNCDGPARRETDTMDTFVDSSWYFFRYIDPDNEVLPFDPALAEVWAPVDQYIGGDDHAVMHLIYARFWTKVMKDAGMVKFDEPFKRLLTQGMVVGETFFEDSSGKRVYYPPEKVEVERDSKGKITSAFAISGDGDKGVPAPLKHAIERMSKSKGNGVDPDEMVEIYGADAARLFILFAAPIENELVWNEAGIEGGVRFLQRVWRLVYQWRDTFGHEIEGVPVEEPGSASRKLRQKTHQTIKRVGDAFETLQFNTPVAGLMELANAISDVGVEPDAASPAERFAVREALTSLILMLTPFAPHAAEEMFSVIIGNNDGMLANGARFPEFSEELAKADEIEIPVQINGKLRSRVLAAPDTPDDVLETMAFGDDKIREYTDGKEIAKVIVVPGRLVNIVVKG